MTEVANLAELRNLPHTGFTNGDLFYIKGHSTLGDGGGGTFMWRTDQIFINGIYQNDNNGTIIKTTSIPGQFVGRFVRQYEGNLNVLYFGAFGKTQDYTNAFQNAVEFATLNTLNDPELKDSVIYIPNGNYRINQLTLKSGISLIGESMEKTLIQTTVGHNVDYMFKIEAGPVILNMSNLFFFGRDETNAGCFLFEAQAIGDPIQGGLWNSSFKNIQIKGFKGHGIYLMGGEPTIPPSSNPYVAPNQFNTFENVRVVKTVNFSNALKMTGQNGQDTFLNCTFDGYSLNNHTIFPKGHNVNISNVGALKTAILSFINCIFQDADYGIYIDYAENINIDGCWFENLGVAITVNGTYNSCRDITIQNNRFANAAGYGSLPVSSGNIKSGQCISILNSFVNVYNNYVTVSETDGPHLNPNSSFLISSNNVLGGVAISDNVFQVNKLGKTFGVMQVVDVSTPNKIDCGRNKLVFVNTSSTIIKSIVSSINASETITIRANGGTITFDNTKNIFLTHRSTFSLANGEIAVFMKIDNIVGSYYETYQLISVMRAPSP